jgi:hypothetical protein
MKLLFGVFLFAVLAAAQGTDAVVTGTVLDPAGAAMPDTSVTALNTDTGVSKTVKSDSAGVYEFPTLPPGNYTLSADKAGFKKYVLGGLALRTGDHVQQNLKLEVGSTTESVQVTASSEGVQYLTASQGGLVNATRIEDLPVNSRNVMDFVATQAGVVGTNFNGARNDMLNITLDGSNIQDNFITESIGTTQIAASVDRVEEMKVVTSPADAEYGRGSGQVQLVSRSGTNQYHGSAYDFAHNTDLNANSWANNRNGIPRSVEVENQVGGRLAGPIKKNKTFFFGLFEGNIQHFQSTSTATVLTSSARQGIFRFYPGVTNANSQAAKPTVDINGNPITPAGATGPLQSVSLFGLDPNRMAPDTTGIVAKNLALLPLPNTFNTGDGLNTAGYNFVVPSSDDIYSFTVRIDHNFSEKQRLTASYDRDMENYPNGFDSQPLPTSPPGDYKDTAEVGSVALISTITSNLVNEARIGLTKNGVYFLAPWNASPLGQQGILPSLDGTSYILAFPTVGTTTAVTSPLATSTAEDPQGRTSPVYEARDRITWLHGKHTFKAGLDRRYTSANSYVSFDAVPRVTLGVAASTGTQNITTIPGIGANGSSAGNLLAMLAGSVASENQYFYATAGKPPVYLPGQNAQHTWKEREWGTFFQDDFKARNNLTLSFGLRWDYYGTPYAAAGNLASIVGGSSSIFGISGSTLGALFNPGVYNINNLTQTEYIGKNSPNPNVNPWNSNNKNFAPTVGLAWSLPWFGKDKTVFRAGYGIAYERNTLVLVDQLFGYSVPGYLNQVAYAPPSYQNLVNSTLPLTPTSAPFATVPINDTNATTQTLLGANSGLKTPYIQNWNTSIGRQLSKGLTIDVRYVGSKGTKMYRGSNINENNIFESGILSAFEVTDAGGNAPLFNQIFKGLNISGVGVVDGVNITGSQAVRQNTTLNAYLLANNVGGFANFLAYNTFVTGIRGGLLKNGGLPPNLIAANPQFGSVYYISNDSNSTYNSGQVEINKRFSNGFQLQSAYVRSKALGDYDGTSQSETAAYYTDRNHHLDKRLLSFDRTNVITSSGIFDVPFGPGKKYLSSSHGALARVVERWQTAIIFNKYSGTPTTFTDSAGETFNNTATATAVLNGPMPSGSVHIVGNNVEYFNNLTQVTDPSAKNLPSSLQSQSALFAVQNASGQTILQNPALGTLGGLSPTAFRGLGTFTLNAQASKSIVISKEHNFTLKLRADAINLLNHEIWTTPSLNIDSTSFGLITAASGARTFNLSVRLEF